MSRSSHFLITVNMFLRILCFTCSFQVHCQKIDKTDFTKFYQIDISLLFEWRFNEKVMKKPILWLPRKKKKRYLVKNYSKFFCSLVFQFPSYFIERIRKFFKASSVPYALLYISENNSTTQ